MPDVILHVQHIQHVYETLEQTSLKVLRDVNLQVHKGEIVALMGPSGSGKSTLLHICGLLDIPTSGEIWIDGQISPRDSNNCARIRQKKIGFIYQFHHLLPELTVQENIMVPAYIQAWSKTRMVQRAQILMQHFRLSERAAFYPAQLSGGQAQRVAIARALMTSPQLILADEPTGSLDETNANVMMEYFQHMVKTDACGMLIATHNPALAKKAHRILMLHHGTLHSVDSSHFHATDA